jgi:Transposase DDE domain
VSIGQSIFYEMISVMIEFFPDLPLIAHKQEETITALKSGEIADLRISNELPIDDIVKYGLKEKFLKDGLKSFPDPRKSYDIPIEVLLLPQVIQRLDDEHSLLLAPYMLNSASLLSELGYSARVLEEGFNKKNKYPRTAPFNGETLKHVLLSVKADQLIDWFNTDWNQLMKSNAPGRTKQYIIDGTELLIPKDLFEKFEGAGVVKNSQDETKFGYKVVWIQEIIDRKGVIRALKFAPIQDHDLNIGKDLVSGFDFEEGSLLLMDRGFLDAGWITYLKEERKINICMPLKKNSEITQFAVAQAAVDNKWSPHPTRKEQRIYEIKKSELDWELCQSFKSGVLVNFIKKNGEEENIVFVDTREGVSGKTILATYDQRSEIEESHRQMKCFQGLEKLPSKKYVHVVFRVIMGTIAYNLFNLFLNSEKCATLRDYSLKTHRQKRKSSERNPDVIIYTDTTFAIMKNLDFLEMIIMLKKDVRLKLVKIFRELTS